jgi:cytoskeletal protein CcmA (bactofilin family)
LAEDALTIMPHVYRVLLDNGPTVAVGGAPNREQDLVIDGRLHGGFVVVGRNITVGPGGHVRADIHGEHIVVEGEVEGDLHGGLHILVRSSGSVTGQLVAPSVTLETGSRFRGDVEMRAPERARIFPAENET